MAKEDSTTIVHICRQRTDDLPTEGDTLIGTVFPVGNFERWEWHPANGQGIDNPDVPDIVKTLLQFIEQSPEKGAALGFRWAI